MLECLIRCVPECVLTIHLQQCRLLHLPSTILSHTGVVATVLIAHRLDRQHAHPLVRSAHGNAVLGRDAPAIKPPEDVDREVTLIHRAR